MTVDMQYSNVHNLIHMTGMHNCHSHCLGFLIQDFISKQPPLHVTLLQFVVLTDGSDTYIHICINI